MNKSGSDKKLPFFNLGKDNDYKILLNEEFISEINSNFKDELIKFKYQY